MIVLSEAIWQIVVDETRRTKARVEQILYLDGIEVNEQQVVTTVAIPNAALHRGYFEVSADAMSQAGKHLRVHGLIRLAQIHTHPGAFVDHSEFDDAHTYSQVPGAISIVLPFYGRANPTLHNAGIHVRTKAGWERVRTSEISTVIRLVPGLVDFRRK